MDDHEDQNYKKMRTALQAEKIRLDTIAIRVSTYFKTQTTGSL
jgi:hypothetical protein